MMITTSGHLAISLETEGFTSDLVAAPLCRFFNPTPRRLLIVDYKIAEIDGVSSPLRLNNTPTVMIRDTRTKAS